MPDPVVEVAERRLHHQHRPELPRADEIASVEFAEEDSDKHGVRPVKTKGRLDITDESSGPSQKR